MQHSLCINLKYFVNYPVITSGEHAHHVLPLGTEETKLKSNEENLNPEVENWIDMAGRWARDLGTK